MLLAFLTCEQSRARGELKYQFTSREGLVKSRQCPRDKILEMYSFICQHAKARIHPFAKAKWFFIVYNTASQIIAFSTLLPSSYWNKQRNSCLHLESGSLWGNKFIYRQEFYFLKQNQYFAEDCFWGKWHMFISLCLLKIDRKILLTEVLFTGNEAQTWKALVGCELAAVKILMFFCLRGFHQQRCTGWHFKMVAHQESGNNTLWIGKEMRFIRGISKHAIEGYT